MSVIVSRALPDVRDGLKPVHRRILYTQHLNNNVWNRAYIKCARVVGDVLGRFHPHGDSAAYDALVRLAQDFAMRYTLIDGQGNFGSIDGDPPAAYRYTECRMERIGGELLADIDKETVDFQPNYDDKEVEPTVLPARFPNLLVNGAAGIAVGMATNIPPHNLGEIIDATIAVGQEPRHHDRRAVRDRARARLPHRRLHLRAQAASAPAYETGRGALLMRARTNIEEHPKTGRKSIVATEIPYQVNKAKLIEKIAELVRDKRIDGIADMRDESDRDGMRIVIDLKKDAVPEVVLNNLWKMTPLQESFGINMLAIVDGRPQLLSLKQLLVHFLAHRRDVVDAAHAVRAALGPRPDAHPGGPEDRRRQHRRGHRPDPRVEGHRGRQERPDGDLRAVGAPGAGHPGHAAGQADRPRARRADRRDEGAGAGDRAPGGDPGQRDGADGGRRDRAGGGQVGRTATRAAPRSPRSAPTSTSRT